MRNGVSVEKRRITRQYLPKTENEAEISDHRPIAFFPVSAKIFESIKLYSWIGHPISTQQNGFTESRSVQAKSVVKDGKKTAHSECRPLWGALWILVSPTAYIEGWTQNFCESQNLYIKGELGGGKWGNAENRYYFLQFRFIRFPNWITGTGSLHLQSQNPIVSSCQFLRFQYQNRKADPVIVSFTSLWFRIPSPESGSGS